MKKSVVATIACSSLIRYTAASSPVSMPTSRSGGNGADALRLSRSAQHAGRDLAAAAAAVRKAGQAGRQACLGLGHEGREGSSNDRIMRVLFTVRSVAAGARLALSRTCLSHE